MVTIHEIKTDRSDLKRFVQFGVDLYKGNDCYVPPLIGEEIDTLDPKKNPAFDFCEMQLFMAYDNERPVGRIAAIINNSVNEKTGEKVARFGFVDFVDDAEVVDKLFAAATHWAAERGMTRMIGPMGFTDMDHEGMLIDGFDQLGTMATIYNYPYYPLHMERMGWTKDVDWVEYKIDVPDAIPERYQRIANIVKERLNLKVVENTSRKMLKEKYGHAIFDLINEAYADLYGYSALTPRQIDHYIDMYLGLLRLEDLCLITDADDRLICLGVAMPSMSRALQKSHGRLFPMGWWHLLKAIRGGSNVVDLMLVAVKPEYQNKGVNALLFANLIPAFIKAGYTYAESNLELENNENVQKQWEAFHRTMHRRRRAWTKDI